MLDYDPAAGRTVVEILRHFGAPVTIGRIIHTAPDDTVTQRALPEPVALQAGPRLELALP